MEVVLNRGGALVLFCVWLPLMQLPLLYVKVTKGLVGSDVINYLELLWTSILVHTVSCSLQQYVRTGFWWKDMQTVGKRIGQVGKLWL